MLTFKPLLYVGNVAEEFVADPSKSSLFITMKNEAEKQGAKVLGISAKIE